MLPWQSVRPTLDHHPHLALPHVGDEAGEGFLIPAFWSLRVNQEVKGSLAGISIRLDVCNDAGSFWKAILA